MKRPKHPVNEPYGECQRCGRTAAWATIRRCVECSELVCPACQGELVGAPREKRCRCSDCAGVPAMVEAACP